MKIGEFGLAPVCFQYYETEKKKMPKTLLSNPNPNPDPNPTHRTLAGKNPTFSSVENLVDHIKAHT